MANQGEIVCAAIASQLDTIEQGVIPSGSTLAYENTPAIFRVLAFNEGWTPTPDHKCQFHLWPESETKRLGPESCTTTSQLEIHVLMCRKVEQATENPASGAAPERWQLANTMFADLCQCVYGDFTFGGTARRLIGNEISVEYGREIQGWAVAEARFVVEYATERPGR